MRNRIAVISVRQIQGISAEVKMSFKDPDDPGHLYFYCQMIQPRIYLAGQASAAIQPKTVSVFK